MDPRKIGGRPVGQGTAIAAIRRPEESIAEVGDGGHRAYSCFKAT
jgi:hypothetical protein